MGISLICNYKVSSEFSIEMDYNNINDWSVFDSEYTIPDEMSCDGDSDDDDDDGDVYEPQEDFDMETPVQPHPYDMIDGLYENRLEL
jgi:hypothetical protein